MLAVTKTGPGLHLLDENRKIRAWLNLTQDGSALSLCGENEKPIWKAP